MNIKIKDCSPRKAVALGATLAEQHMASLRKGLSVGTVAPGSLIALDFEGIEGVNASYIKGTALWLLTCGRLSVENTASAIPPRHPADPRPYDVYVYVTGLSPDVQLEFQEFLKPRGLPMLFVQRHKDTSIEKAVLLGHLDPALRFTLDAVSRQGTTTAPVLHRSFPEERVKVTAWNNRLNDLHALRLVRRVRAGRKWEYESLAKEVIWE